MNVKINKFLEPLYKNDFFECDIWGGRGRGGSFGATQYAVLKMISSDYFRGFLLRSSLAKIRTSLWADFKDRIKEISEQNNIDFEAFFKISDHEMKATYLPNGNTIESKGFRTSRSSDTANLKSLASASHIIIEEGEEIDSQEYIKLRDSLRKKGIELKIIRVWNPPSKDHWLIKDYYNLTISKEKGYFEATPKKENVKHLSIFGTYENNFENINDIALTNYERYKITHPEYYYTQIQGLIQEGGERRVYSNWKIEITNEEWEKIDVTPYYGFDFGVRHPNALVGIKYFNEIFYIREFLYLSTAKIKTAIVRKFGEEGYKKELQGMGLLGYTLKDFKIGENDIFCDDASALEILQLQSDGYSAVRAGKKLVIYDVAAVRKCDISITLESKNLYNEYVSYIFGKKIDDEILETPLKKNDDLMDAIKYAINRMIRILEIKL